MIPPPKPWERQTSGTSTINVPADSHALSSSVSGSSIQTNLYAPNSYADAGIIPTVDHGYGFNGMSPYSMGMLGGYGGGFFGSMYGSMGGPFMEIERKGQMIYIFCSRIMEMLGVLTHVAQSAGTHFSGIAHEVATFHWPFLSQGHTQSDSEVVYYYEDGVHTRSQTKCERIVKVVLKLLFRLGLFISLYFIFNRIRQGIAYPSIPLLS